LLAAGLLKGEVSDLPSLEVLQTAVREHFKERVSAQQLSSIVIWEPLVEKKLEKGAGPQAIYDFLRLEEPRFTGSLGAVKRMCIQIKKAKGI